MKGEYGAGRIFKRGKRYGYSIYVDGREVRRMVGRSKAAAEKELAEQRLVKHDRAHAQRIIDASQTAAPKMKLRELVGRWIEAKAKTLKPKTITSYRRTLAQFAAMLGEAPTVKQFTRRAVLDFKTLREGSANNTQKNSLVALASLGTWAMRQDPPLLAVHPVKNIEAPPNGITKKYRKLLPHEVTKLLAASAANANRYDRLWIGFLSTGLRAAQLTHLTWSDLDFAAGTYRALSGYAKDGLDHPALPISNDFRKVLLDILRERHGEKAPPPHECVFLNRSGKPWRNNLLRRFQQCCRLAGLDIVRARADGVKEVLCVHSLRGTFASALIRGGADVKTVQELMQHKDSGTTLGLYAEAAQESKADAVNDLKLTTGPTRTERGRSKRRKSRNAVKSINQA